MNKRKIISATLAVMMLMPYAVKAEESNEVVIHVSVSGKDGGEGTENNPLASLSGAQKKVRELKESGYNARIKVLFHEGDYRFDETVLLESADSGTKENPITYEAAEGEKVRFLGSKKIDINDLKPISDPKIKNRLKKEVVDYVGEIDLKKFGITEVEKFQSFGPHDSATEYSWIYLNDKEQPIAQFPNGDGHYAQWDRIVEAGESSLASTNGGTIQVSGDEITRWKGANDAYLGGYFGWDFRYERINVKRIDTEKKTVTMATGTDLGLKNKESKRWKIFNLLEEIDSPGEWFIDRENLKLYYYAPYNVRNAELEISMMKTPFIETTGAENIVFKDIEFSQNRGYGVFLHEDTDNVTFMNCTFKNISRVAIKTQGSKQGTFEAHYNYLDSPTNVEISNCTFYNIGSSAVLMVGGGNRQTLTESGNVIKNNYISNVSRQSRNKAAIALEGGLGNVIEHNVIHNVPFHAINFFGNEHKILYNNIYNACMENTDAAIIYAGRSFVQRGSEIAYNYISEYRLKGEYIPLDQVPAIYLDDGFGGAYIHHNIIRNGESGIMVNKGHYNKIINNTIVDVDRPLRSYTGGGNTAEEYQDQSMIASIREALKYEGWNERYPDVKKILEGPGVSSGNELTENVVSNEMLFEATVRQYNTNKDNIVYKDKSIFADPEHDDYRLKSDSDEAKKLPSVLSESNFDMSMIGFEKDCEMEVPEGGFNKLYPSNGESNVQSSNIEFIWEEAEGTEKYRLVIAKDPQMKEVVLDKLSDYSFIDVDELSSGRTTYYYNIYAVNENNGTEWASSNVPYRFTTGQYGSVNTAELKESVVYVENIVKGMKTGTDAGLYKPGTKEKAEELLNRATDMLEWKTERDGSQKNIDSLNASLRDVVSEKNVNAGYVGMDYAVGDVENWATNQDKNDGISFDADTVTVGSKTNSIVALYRETQSVMASKNTVAKFRMKCDLSGGWIGMGTRCVVDSVEHLYVAAQQCYFFAIKKDVIEFQKTSAGIIEEIPNTYINDGEWHEIEFGVLNRKDCPVVILNVDGKKVCEYYDTSLTQKFAEGGFSLTTTGGRFVSIKPSEEKEKEFPAEYEKLLNNIPNENCILYKAGSDRAICEDEVTELAENKAVVSDGKLYIPLRLSAEKLGMDVSWNNKGYAEISGAEVLAEIYPKENAWYKDGIKTETESPVIFENGTVKISVEDLCGALNLKYKMIGDDAVAIGRSIGKSEEYLKGQIDILTKTGGKGE